MANDNDSEEARKDLKKVLEGVLQAGESIYARGGGRPERRDEGGPLPPGGLMLATNFRVLVFGRREDDSFYLEAALPYNQIAEVEYGEAISSNAPVLCVRTQGGKQYRLEAVEKKKGADFVGFVTCMMKANAP